MELGTNVNYIKFDDNGRYKTSIAEKGALFFKDHVPDNFMKHIDFQNKGLNRKTSLVIALGIILGSRYCQARGESEKREILTIDTITIGSVFAGIPILKKIYGHILPLVNGFKVTQGDGLIDTGFMPSESIDSSYSIKTKKNSKDALLDFCNNIKKIGGDIEKIFQSGEESLKTAVKSIVGDTSLLDNNSIIKKITESNNNEAINKIVDHLKNADSKILQKAKNLKAAPEALFYIAMIATLGFLLPKLTMQHTKELLAQNAENLKNTSTTNNTPNYKIDIQRQQLIANLLKR